jgi:hypothetical protein
MAASFFSKACKRRTYMSNEQVWWIDDPEEDQRKRFDELVERYTLMCNLIEAIWLAAKSDEDNLNALDLNDLPPLTSDGARRIASFIEDVYTNGACSPSDRVRDHHKN